MMSWATAFVQPDWFCSVWVWAGRLHSWGVPTSFPLLFSLQVVIASKTVQSPRLVHFTPISFAVYILWRLDSFEEGFRSFSPESKNKLRIKSGINFCLLTLRHQMDGLTAPTCRGCVLGLDTHVASQMTALGSVSVMETDVVSLWWSGVEQCSSI